MKPKQWENVRDQIKAARERRASNVLTVATRAGLLVADSIEARHGEALQSRRPHRLRLLIEIDLVTGEASATAEPMPEPDPEPASGLPS